MEKEMINQLIDTAIHQLKYSYTPYSNFKVGAALPVSYTHLTLPTKSKV